MLCDFSGLPNHTFWVKNSLRTPSGVTTSCYQWESEDSGIWSEDMMGGVLPAWDTRLLSASLWGAALTLSQAWSVPEEPPTSLNQFVFVLDSPKLKTESLASHMLHESPGWQGWWLTATHIFTLLSSWISPCQPWWPASCVYIVPSKPFECLHHSTNPFPFISFHPNHLCICFSSKAVQFLHPVPWLLSAVLCPSFPASLDLLISIISTNEPALSGHWHTMLLESDFRSNCVSVFSLSSNQPMIKNSNDHTHEDVELRTLSSSHCTDCYHGRKENT